MLDRLPAELLLDILLLTLPPEIQPLLWEVVRLKGYSKPNLEEKPELAKHIRILQASGPRPPLCDVLKVVKQLSNLVKVRLEHYPNEQLSEEDLRSFSGASPSSHTFDPV
jgi:hypothetical protein